MGSIATIGLNETDQTKQNFAIRQHAERILKFESVTATAPDAAAIEAFLLTLPTSLPGGADQLWWDGGILSKTAGPGSTITGSAIYDYLVSLPTSFPVLPNKLWWSGGVLAKS